MQSKQSPQRRWILILAIILFTAGLLLSTNPTTRLVQASSDNPTPEPPIDHGEFEILQRVFATGPDVTRACLTCHESAAQEIQQTSHWTWEFEHPTTGQMLGKQNVINNFCIAVGSNEQRCTSCHAGYGWEDNTFDFTTEENVDCLVCHDTTGTYKKLPTAAGHPIYEEVEYPAGSGVIWTPPDLTQVAQNVGPTSRVNCGSCHFYGGGDDAVKHGDMDSSLVEPDHSLDVHMDAQGLDFSCTKCHTSDNHQVKGGRYSMNATDDETCETCHTAEPHKYDLLNGHGDRLACQTCHIPEYARGGVPTKMWWDWSLAGDQNRGIEKDEDGNITYYYKKGEFSWGENIVPEYIWFNGEVSYTLLSDSFDDTEIITINQPQGSIADLNARIWPMKVFRGTQPYDAVNKTLVVPHLYGEDETAYWTNLDWGKAIESGMDYINVPYSGKYGFIETQMYWPITHMVAPAEDALACLDCHTGEDGRLDFTALGYSAEEAHRLTHFPPTLELEMLDAPVDTPAYCGSCHDENSYNHEEHYELWKNSTHGENGVGCVACHQPEGAGIDEHPKTAYTVDQSANLCGACHLHEHRDWEPSGHAANDNPIACIDCHEPHTQNQRIASGHTTSCESCHKSQVMELTHSTHAAADLYCLDCHKNTERNTGHTFYVESDTCMSCHATTIHTAAHIAKLTGGVVEQADLESAPTVEVEEAEHAAEESATDVSGEARLNLPMWAMVALGMIIGVAAFWVVAGKNPGSEHPENAPDNADEDEKG
jgi:octaheme c-type cytochrome (tetrathionate reductase family)